MRSADRPRFRLVALMAAVFVLASGAYALAQFRNRNMLGAGSGTAPTPFPDGDFVICRLMYNEGRRFGQGWRTDYPLGERNLSTRFSELTRTRVSRASDGSPNHYLVRPGDDQLFACPFVMAGDIGSIDLSEDDAVRLREYLLKGGFLWTDDMWGEDQWETWASELAKIFPPAEYPVEDLTPADPIFRSQFVVPVMPQIPNIGYWRQSGGDTSERGAYSAVPMFRVVRDHHGRIMVAMTHNTDIADAFEREGDDPVFFSRFARDGYSLGINVLLYALTH